MRIVAYCTLAIGIMFECASSVNDRVCVTKHAVSNGAVPILCVCVPLRYAITVIGFLRRP